MLLEPPRTPYDLHFQIAGIPIRVHPFFWLAGLVLGASGSTDRSGNVQPDAGMYLLIWLAVVFVSILVHELGHAVAIRVFGQVPRIVLYMLGGLAITESAPFTGRRAAHRSPREQILISLAGPGAGFLLATLVVTWIYALGGEFYLEPKRPPFFYSYALPFETGRALSMLIGALLWINIAWGLVNLLPVYPLDGGQIARQLFELSNPWNGFTQCLWLSIITAGAVAVAGFVYLDSWFMGLLFISLAASNYMTLQQMGGGGFGGRPW
jgi:stage IV sporulation protein FB